MMSATPTKWRIAHGLHDVPSSKDAKTFTLLVVRKEGIKLYGIYDLIEDVGRKTEQANRNRPRLEIPKALE